MEGRTVKQHYIPRFFLERFADENGIIYVYDMEHDSEYEPNYENIGFVNNLYETKWSDANPKLGDYVLRNDIENVLAGYDAEFSAFLRDLDKRIIPDQNPNALICNKKDKMVLKRFIANLLFRNPETMEMLNSEESLQRLMSNEEVKIICEAMDLMGLSGGKSVVEAASKKATVTEEFEGGLAGKYIKLIDKVPFMFLYSISNSFIFSDMPVSTGIDSNALGENKTFVFLPLSSQYAVLFGDYENTEKNKIAYIDEKNTDIMVDGYIKKNYSGLKKLYFNNAEQRSLIVSKIKEAYYAEI